MNWLPVCSWLLRQCWTLTRNLFHAADAGLDKPKTENFGCVTRWRVEDQQVRFVQVWSGRGGARAIGTIMAAFQGIVVAAGMDQPTAALLTDLRNVGC